MDLKKHIKRPGEDHPDPVYWESLRKAVIDDQDGKCATCPNDAADYPLDLHHRHYANWGKEDRKDVVILCRLCHDQITSSFRSRCFANNKLAPEPMRILQKEEKISYGKRSL